MNQTKDCPNCGTLNSNNSDVCECGYEYNINSEKDVDTKKTPEKKIRTGAQKRLTILIVFISIIIVLQIYIIYKISNTTLDISSELDIIKSDILSISYDVSSINGDMSRIESEVSSISYEVSCIGSDVRYIKIFTD